MAQESHNAWLESVVEEPIEPLLPIVDAHHHIWYNHPTRKEVGTYMLQGKYATPSHFHSGKSLHWTCRISVRLAPDVRKNAG